MSNSESSSKESPSSSGDFNEEDFERRITIYTADDLASDVPPQRFIIEQVMPESPLGVIAGPMKSLKSWLGVCQVASIITGEPLFGRFEVPRQRHAHMMYGEGGRHEFQRRLHHVLRSLGFSAPDIKSLPITSSHETAPLNSDVMARHIRDVLFIEPTAVVFPDSLYVYHPADVLSSDLYQRGSELHRFSYPILAGGGGVNLTDHFNKTGSGVGLDRISHVGVQQWANCWLLVEHREPPNVQEGKFQLRIEVGGRSLQGGVFDLDVATGILDYGTGQYLGDFTTALRSTDLPPGTVGHQRGSSSKSPARSDHDIMDDIMARVWDHPGKLNKTRAVDGHETLGFGKITGSKSRALELFDELVARGFIALKDGEVTGKDGKSYPCPVAHPVEQLPLRLHKTTGEEQ